MYQILFERKRLVELQRLTFSALTCIHKEGRDNQRMQVSVSSVLFLQRGLIPRLQPCQGTSDQERQQ